jgi:HEAT repeat protein
LSQNGATLDLQARAREVGRPGLALVSEAGEYPSGTVALYGCDGVSRWQLHLQCGAGDVQLLPANHVLVAETDANRVAERTLGGALFWSRGAERPDACRRLANGNTFAASRARCLEVGADGWQSYLTEPKPMYNSGDALQPLPGGVLVGIVVTDKPPYTINEIQVPGGGIRRRVTLPRTLAECSGPTKLVNGHYLLGAYSAGGPGSESQPVLVEVDRDGKVLRRLAINHCGPLEPLHSGNTLVPCREAVVEVDALGRVQWEAFTANAVLRARVCMRLVRFGFGRPAGIDLANSLEYRVKGLRDRRAIVRARSANALSRFGPRARAAVPQLVEMLADADDLAAGAAASAVKDIGPAAAPRLIEALRDPRTRIRAQCARLLYNFPSAARAAVPALLPLLDDRDTHVRAAAAAALGPMATRVKAIVPALLRAAADRSPEVREAAVRTLGDAGPAALPAVPFLLRGLRGPDIALAIDASLALGRLGPVDPAVIPALVEALHDERVCANAADALGMMGPCGKPAARALARALLQPAVVTARADLQCAAALALSKVGDPAPATLSAMLRVLQDPKADPRVGGTVGASLASFGKKAGPAVPSLTAIFVDRSLPKDARRAALHCLLRIRRPDAAVVAALRRVADEDKGELAELAARVLVDIANADADMRRHP